MVPQDSNGGGEPPGGTGNGAGQDDCGAACGEGVIEDDGRAAKDSDGEVQVGGGKEGSDGVVGADTASRDAGSSVKGVGIYLRYLQANLSKVIADGLEAEEVQNIKKEEEEEGISRLEQRRREEDSLLYQPLLFQSL